jgi:hypothetical protein
MAQRNTTRDTADSMKKDRQAVQRLRDEIDEQTGSGSVRAQQRDRNRDAARGDWDRSSRHHDEGVGREPQGDESRAEERYPSHEE